MKYLNNRSVILSSLLPVLLLISPISAYSDVPQVISYSGQLSDSGGTPIGTTATPVDVDLIFNIYEDADNNGIADGATIWTEEHSVANGNTEVTVTNGLFGVSLGSVNTTAGTTLGELKFDVPYLLGIKIKTETNEMTPLLRLTSAPTALRSENTKGSSVTVNCPTDSIQDALDAGATTITVNGVCSEAVNITRSGVTLTNGTGGGITAPAAGNPSALSITGASQVTINGLALSVDGASVAENCVLLMSGANVTFSGVSVTGCPDISMSVLLNSSVSFSGAASSISGSVIGLEIVAGSSAQIVSATISASEEGVFVGGNSFAFLEGSSSITATGSIDAVALGIEGSSSVEVDSADINAPNGNGVNIFGSSSLALFDEGGTITIDSGDTGVFVFSGSLQLERGLVTSTSGSAVEIHNTSTAYVTDDAGAATGLSGATYGVACYSNAVLSTLGTPTITGTTAATNGTAGGSNFCNAPAAP